MKYLPTGTVVPKAVYFNPLPDHAHNRVGNIEEFNDKTAEFFARGMWIVKDLITGSLTGKRFANVVTVNPTDVKGRYGLDFAFEVEQAWRDVWSEYYNAVSDRLEVFGAGALFSVGVGDGSANYRVTKVTKTKAHVEWVGICCDDYYDHHFGGGGTFPLEDVKRYCRIGGIKLPTRKRMLPADHRDWFDLEKAKLVPGGMLPASVLAAVRPVRAG